MRKKSGKKRGALVVLTVAVLTLTSLPTWANEPEKVGANPWEIDGKCLEYGVGTYHGLADYIPHAGEEAQWTGEFHGEARSTQDMHIGIDPFSVVVHCAKSRVKDPDQVQVKIQILKLKDGSWPVCYSSSWLGNSTPSAFSSYSVYTNLDVGGTANKPGPCGLGSYKTQIFARMFENGNWVPAANPCTTSGPPCTPPLINDYHTFSADRCHVQPETCPGH